LNLKAINSGEIRTLLLNRRDQPAIHVSAKFEYLDQEARWLRIRLISNPMNGSQGSFLSNPYLKFFLEVNSLYELTELSEALNRFVALTRQILQTEAVVIYLADPAFPQLQKQLLMSPTLCFQPLYRLLTFTVFLKLPPGSRAIAF